MVLIFRRLVKSFHEEHHSVRGKKSAQTPPAARQENNIILARVLAGSRLRLLIISLTESTEQLSRGWGIYDKACVTHW